MGRVVRRHPHPYILLQLRSWLSGHLAVLPHPAGAGNDYLWGRGGMHTAWGLGVPILSLPFHLAGRLFGAPGFPDSARFLCLYAITTAVLARALHRSSRGDGLVAGAAAAGFVMVFPTYVGLLASRFAIYEQTIAIGALWCVLLMAGVMSVLAGCSTASLAAVCAAAGFSAMLRPPLAIYGLTTAVLALFIARRRGATRGALVAGAATYVTFAALYFIGNTLRFGAPLNAGYENVVAGPFVGRMARWGVSFMKVPYGTALKEMFATPIICSTRSIPRWARPRRPFVGSRGVSGGASTTRPGSTWPRSAWSLLPFLSWAGEGSDTACGSPAGSSTTSGRSSSAPGLFLPPWSSSSSMPAWERSSRGT